MLRGAARRSRSTGGSSRSATQAQSTPPWTPSRFSRAVTRRCFARGTWRRTKTDFTSGIWVTTGRAWPCSCKRSRTAHEARGKVQALVKGSPWSLGAATTAVLLALGPVVAAGGDLYADVNGWRLIPRESGPVNYYRVVGDPLLPYIHAAYEPGYKTAVMGFEVPNGQARAFHRLTWKWRADVLPRGGDECAPGEEDSAAVVYVTWKRGLKWYSL